MSYYKTCPYCGCHLDHGEACDCVEALRDRAISAVLKLTEEQCALVNRSFAIYQSNPELTPEECMKIAAQSATNTQGGKAEQI